MHLNTYNAYEKQGCFAVPYQHHKNAQTWKVDAGSPRGHKTYQICASSAESAASRAIELYLLEKTPDPIEEDHEHSLGLQTSTDTQ